LKNDAHFEFDITCYPGATLSSLRLSVKLTYDKESVVPDAVIIHVGTNSIARGISVQKALQQTKDLVEAARTVTQCSNVYVSLILPRWDCQETYDKVEELNVLFEKYFSTIDCRKEVLLEELFATDKLHLNAVGSVKFAEAFYQELAKLYFHVKTLAASTPRWWSPPLHRLKSKRELKKQAEREQLPKQPPAPCYRTPRLRPFKTIKTKVDRMRISKPEGYTSIGFKDMCTSKGTEVVLPLPSDG